MNSFSINRFWQMLRWLISVNRVRLLGFTVGIMFSTLLIQLMMFVFGSFEKIIPFLWSCVHFGSFLITFVILFTVCLAFTSFTSIGSKQQRGTWLMIPATNLEKFLSLIVYVTVICGLCAIVGYILGDCLRMGCLWIGAQLSADPAMKAFEVYNYNGVDGTYNLWSSTVYWLFCDMTPHLLTVWGSSIYWSWFEWASWIVHTLIAIWIHSFFTLGGTLLRKYAFVATGVFWIAIMLLFMGSLAHFNVSVFGNVTLADGTIVTMKVNTMAYVLMVVLPLLSYFNYRASFHIFKGFQLITNKWTNYDILKR